MAKNSGVEEDARWREQLFHMQNREVKVGDEAGRLEVFKFCGVLCPWLSFKSLNF
jgi:hypothetical protein